MTTGKSSPLSKAAKALWLALWLALPPNWAGAQGWLEPFSELRPDPGSLDDARLPLTRRIALARRWGRHGPEHEATEALLGGLSGKPPPLLRDAILTALARRAPPQAAAPLAKLLTKSSGRPPASLLLALAAIGSGPARTALLRALEDPQRAPAASRALARIGTAAVPDLERALGGAGGLGAAATLDAIGRAAAPARAALLSQLASPESQLRAAAAAALGALGPGEPASPEQRALLQALLERLADPDGATRAAAAASLPQIATAGDGARLAQALARAEPVDRVPLLRALSRADPARARPALARALANAKSAAEAASILTGDTPDPSWLPLLLARFEQSGDADAASALSRLGEPGLAALLSQKKHRQAAASAVAIALRRWGQQLSPALRSRALSQLRELPRSPRRLRLLALAADPQISQAVREALGASDPAWRAAAAQALAWGAAAKAAAALEPALLREPHPEVFRRMAEAAVALSLRPPWQALKARFDDPETGPEALLLAASATRGMRPAPPRPLRAELRARLAGRGPTRLRVAAAQALGILGDARGRRPLLSALDDPAPRLRLAAIMALATLPTTKAEQTSSLRRELRGHFHIERDGAVRSTLHKLLSGADTRTLESRGPRVLHLAIEPSDDRLGPNPAVDVLLPDGRWLRQKPLGDREIFIPGLPAGDAEIRLSPQ
ncbi:MAG: HEAT repeat domain-containing protein [Myxococcales bacterium]|nr:HEAT repeat domain-containing protein [Myxococcales bacterium]